MKRRAFLRKLRELKQKRTVSIHWYQAIPNFGTNEEEEEDVPNFGTNEEEDVPNFGTKEKPYDPTFGRKHESY